MVRGIFIPSGDILPIVEDDYPGLEELQDAVDGLIEPVYLPAQGCTMYVNEEGLRRGLEFNARATLLWWFFVPAVRNKAMLVGHAVILGSTDHSGEFTQVPRSIKALLLHEGRFVIDVLFEGDEEWQRQTVMPETIGDAMVWAILFAERVSGVKDTRVSPLLWD